MYLLFTEPVHCDIVYGICFNLYDKPHVSKKDAAAACRKSNSTLTRIPDIYSFVKGKYYLIIEVQQITICTLVIESCGYLFSSFYIRETPKM